VLAASRALLALANLACRRGHLRGEAARKSLHVGMGTLFLACPWLFGNDARPVIALAATYVALLFAARHCPMLRRHVRGVIYAVERTSWGEYGFPACVAILYWLARGDRLQFGVPLALLTYADAAAALVGTRYGSIRFVTPGGGRKSLEGSAAFAVAAFLLTHVPLLLSGRVGAGASLAIAAGVAVLTAAAEALCWSGIDNLVVPMLALAMLHLRLKTSGLGL
jgi:phytol kinase